MKTFQLRKQNFYRWYEQQDYTNFVANNALKCPLAKYLQAKTGETYKVGVDQYWIKDHATTTIRDLPKWAYEFRLGYDHTH